MPRQKQDLGGRLRRVLAMVPWLLAQEESTVEAVAERFGMTEDEVVNDLNLIMCCGVPPYGGGDMITISLDEDGTIMTWPGPYLSRPMQLTPTEGFSVLAAGRALLAVPGAEAGGPLASAMTKLEAALGEGGVEVELDAPPLLQAVRDAAAEGRQLRIRYYSAWRDELTDRTIEPWAVYTTDGHWYVDAFDAGAEGERRFRVDRIQSCVETGATFEPPAGAAPPERVFTPGPEAERVTLALPADGRWVVETYDAEEVVDLGDGRLRVTLLVAGERWLERLLLRLGAGAVVEAPPSMATVGATAAARLLSRYR